MFHIIVDVCLATPGLTLNTIGQGFLLTSHNARQSEAYSAWYLLCLITLSYCHDALSYCHGGVFGYKRRPESTWQRSHIPALSPVSNTSVLTPYYLFTSPYSRIKALFRVQGSSPLEEHRKRKTFWSASTPDGFDSWLVGRIYSSAKASLYFSLFVNWKKHNVSM